MHGNSCSREGVIGSQAIAHFVEPMWQVEDHMNSSAFAAIHCKGLMGLAKELRPWCEELIRRQGERLSKE